MPRERTRTAAARAVALAAPLCLITLSSMNAAPRPSGSPEYIVEDTGLRFAPNATTGEAGVFPGLNEDGRVASGSLDVRVLAPRNVQARAPRLIWTAPGVSRPAGGRYGPAQVALPLHAFRTNAALTVQEDLGTLPGDFFSNGFDINESGQVSGLSFGELSFRGIRASGDSPTTLEDLGIFFGSFFSVGFRLNGAGVVVGAADRLFDLRGRVAPAGTDTIIHAVRHIPGGGLQDLGQSLPLFNESAAYGINESGDCVGRAHTLDTLDITTAFRFLVAEDDAQFLDPTFVFVASSAYDINDAPLPQTVGEVDIGTSPFAPRGGGRPTRAFRHTDVTGIVPLGALPGQTESRAFALNDQGDVVGSSGPSWSTGHTSLISMPPLFLNHRAFLFTDAAGMRDLNDLIPPDSDWHLSAATDINDQGQIVGVGLFDGVPAVFRLTPSGGVDNPPSLSKCLVNPRLLGPGPGSVSLSTLAADDFGVASVAALIVGPQGGEPIIVPLSFDSSGRWIGVFSTPANETSNPQVYSVRFRARDTADQDTELDCGVFTVRASAAPDEEPPVIANCTASPRTLPTDGGSVTVDVHVTDNRGVSSVIARLTRPGVTDFLEVPLTRVLGNHFRGTVPVVPDVPDRPLVYDLTIEAVDTSENGANEECGQITVAEAPTGTGSLSVSDGSLRFGDICIGNYATRGFTITNSGEGTLTGAISGLSGPFEVLVSGGRSFSLEPGETLRVRVRFVPRSQGSFSGSVRISSSDPSRPSAGVAVTGTGCRRRRGR